MQDLSFHPDYPKGRDDWTCLKSEWIDFQRALSIQQYRLDNKTIDGRPGAFSQQAMQTAARHPDTWIKTWIKGVFDEKGNALFDNLAWFALKVSSMACSASAC